MNIHEYQAKALLAKFAVPLLKGGVAYTKDEAMDVARKLGGAVTVVKSQIHAGGRGKGRFKDDPNGKGGVRIAKSIDEVGQHAAAMLGHELVTKQTGPVGKTVKRLYIEQGVDIKRELYLSMLVDRSFDNFRLSLATLTGGSGAVAVVLTDGSFPGGHKKHKLLGGVYRSACEHHELCIWHRDHMSTDATAVLKHGVALGRETWAALLAELGMKAEEFSKVICHQVGGAHKKNVLEALGIPVEKDFSTYEYLGNMGTVALPAAAAIAEEREFLAPGDNTAFLGIGSGLNTIMLGVKW